MRDSGRWRKAAPALIVAAVMAAAGCGGDDDEETVTVPETVETSTGAESTDDGATTEVDEKSGSGQAEDATASAAGGTHIGPRYFQTPSGNIGCYVSARAARCDIRKRSWKPTPPPEPCELDYGQGIAVGDDHAEFICAGDTALGGPNTLEYGQVSRRGDFRCRSGRKGITCSNAANGDGFFLSRESYRIF